MVSSKTPMKRTCRNKIEASQVFKLEELHFENVRIKQYNSLQILAGFPQEKINTWKKSYKTIGEPKEL